MDFEELDQYLLSQQRTIIHQVWFGTIPNQYSARKTWKKLERYRLSWDHFNPNMCHVVWNKKNSDALVKQYYSEFYEMYSQYPYEIQRCDCVRYCILHRYSGIYCDMDYRCTRSFEGIWDLYPSDVLLVQTPNFSGPTGVSNSLMLSKHKEHLFWKKLLLELHNGRDHFMASHSKQITVMWTTGPRILSRTFNLYRFRYKLGMLPSDLFHPISLTKSYAELMDEPARDTIYAIHMGGSAWVSADGEFLITLYQNMGIILSILALLIPQFFL
jgi:inositol phosphorylceramide mannosyltransferase catalytic subunit